MWNYLKKLGQMGKVGYEAWFILGGIAFVVLFFWPPLKYSPNKANTGTDLCVYNPPIQSETFTDEGRSFDLIKSKAPIVIGQVLPHLESTKRILKVKGVDRKVYRVLLDANGQVGASTWHTDGDTGEDWSKVRFVDITDTITSPTPGNRYFDIYIERGSSVPKFASRHCSENPTDERFAISDNNDNSFPPKEIDSTKIQNWQCPPARSGVEAELCQKFITEQIKDIYYLYAYDTDNNEIVKGDNRNGYNPRGKLALAGGSTTAYDVVYFGGFESKHLRLVTEDPLNPGQKIGYRYARVENLSSPEDPYKNLNKNKTTEYSLQLQAFTPWKIPPAGWWTPECKPAIYLYPKNKMNVNVKVSPKGFFTYTDPVYNMSKGWNVTAYPDGKLVWLDKDYGINSKGEKRSTNIYDYLYYESKIHDSLIEKPTTGFVIAYAELEAFYREILPKLGLNEQETNDYIDYWLPILPVADSYFIGVLSDQNVDEIEPMTITPQADNTLRVRLYYEALDETEAAEKMQTTQKPEFSTKFNRNGFTVVEWGGMVKNDKDHPFTCSM